LTIIHVDPEWSQTYRRSRPYWSVSETSFSRTTVFPSTSFALAAAASRLIGSTGVPGFTSSGVSMPM